MSTTPPSPRERAPETPRPAGPLAGVCVVELGDSVAPAFCARLLADLGAEVIKVEPPGGSALRHGPAGEGAARPRALHIHLDAGKRSVVLDPAAEAECRRLLAAADILVTDAGSDAAGRKGVPATVVLTPLGTSGPLARTHARDLNVCALSGASAGLGEPRRPPLALPGALASLIAGMNGAAAALVAWRAARLRGTPCVVDIAAAEVLAFTAGSMHLFTGARGAPWRRRGFERHGPAYPAGFYPCGDGFIFIATQSRHHWEAFRKVMGDPEWARVPPFDDGVAIGHAHADEADLHFIPWLTSFTRRQLVELAASAGLVLGPINRVPELLDDPQLEARSFWATLGPEATGAHKPLKVPGPPYHLSRTPCRVGPVPRLGEATEELCTASGSRERAPLAARGERGAAPLAGLRVIDFGWNWAGPLVGQIMADLGAEVIRVESRRRLDYMRKWRHARAFFHNANRGKLGVTIDVSRPQGVELVLDLARLSDAFIDNFAAGVIRRLGLGPEALLAANPRLVVLSMAMAGQEGPLRHLRGFATMATGFAGLEMMVGYPDTGPTGLASLGLGDFNAAIHGLAALLAALEHRDRTGEGQAIDLSQIEASTSLVGEQLVELQLTGREPEPAGHRDPVMAPHGVYPAAGEDRWIAIAVGSDEEWRGLVRALGEPAWGTRPELASGPGRIAHAGELDGLLATWTRERDRDEAAALLQRHGVAATPVLELEEVLAHPHFRERELWTSLREGENELRLFHTPWHVSGVERELRGGAPEVGADNKRVLRGLLGLDEATYGRLVAEGIVA